MVDSNKLPLNIEDELRNSFLDYAMSVIISRALPDVRDGLKPVHRRILYAMHVLKNTHTQAYKKSARVVGDVIGKYHPHGDSAVYDALVRLAQDFSMRYTLVDGQGNFGSIDGDPPAAMRYTEVRMHKMASELLADLEKNTVDFTPNYDDSQTEPAVLPTRVPNLLLNGAVGIAVGMATNIPPHNLTEVVDACVALLDDPDLDARGVLQFVKGPDFPTRGLILGRAGIQQAYLTSRGSVTVRARCDIEEDAKGREAIVVTEIPYQVNKTRLIERIAQLVREKRLEGISDIQDYSDRTGMRIWIQAKRDAAAQVVLNQLYKMTDLQTSVSINMIAIVDGRPQKITLIDALRAFLDHRRQVVTRRSRFELDKAVARREIVQGLGVAIDAIDKIIALIRGSKDPETARAALLAEPLQGCAGFLERCERPEHEILAAREGPYYLSERQAKAILDMRLQRLTGLEREKIEAEFKVLCVEITYLEGILSDTARLDALVRDELLEIRYGYGDPEGHNAGAGGPESTGSRQTEIVDVEHEIQAIDLVADESMIVMATQHGYVKRLPTSEYRVQARGGVGIKGGGGRDDDDFVVEMFEASAKAWVLIFTNTGRVFRKRVFELPLVQRGNKPKAWANFLELKEGETIHHMLPYREADIDDDHFVLLASKQGFVKRTSLREFENIRTTGLIAVRVEDDDQLVGVHLTDGQRHVVMATAGGMSIRFSEADIRPMGRTARGVKGISLRADDEVVSVIVIDEDSQRSLLTICGNGYGKRTEATEYRPQSRGGKGIITIKCNSRNGAVVSTSIVAPDDEVLLVTDRGKVIRTPADGISQQGRNTQGVRIIRMRDGEHVVALERIIGDTEADAADADADADADAEETAPPPAEETVATTESDPSADASTNTDDGDEHD